MRHLPDAAKLPMMSKAEYSKEFLATGRLNKLELKMT
jgi:hypothetical protein